MKIFRSALWISIVFAGNAIPALAAPTTETPEKETARIAKFLKPIPDDEWKQIAGSQLNGGYEITRGDTLSGISKRLFGDPKYWPKIWSMNNGSITNPHLIRPGNSITFLPGTGTTLPSVAIEETQNSQNQGTTATDVQGDPIFTHSGRSREWQELPHQPWERSTVPQDSAQQKLPDIQVMGDFKKLNNRTLPDDLPAFATTKQIDPVGFVVSSPAVVEDLRLGDSILIQGAHGSDGIQVGETYSLVYQSAQLESRKKNRQGYSYRTLGEFTVVGPEKNQWVARITKVTGPIVRGTVFIPKLPPVPVMDPIPGPSEEEGRFYLDRADSIWFVGENQVGFVNLGSEDGVQPGMVFEAFQTKDGMTAEPFASANLFRVVDIQAIQVTEGFSTVVVISGTKEIYEGTPVHLLMDISKFRKYGAVSSTVNGETAPKQEQQNWDSLITNPNPSAMPSGAPTTNENSDTPPAMAPGSPETNQQNPGPKGNELDPYDTEDQLNADEKKELQQLEKYKPSAPTTAPSGTPDTGAPPAGAPLQEAQEVESGAAGGGSTEAPPAGNAPTSAPEVAPSNPNTSPAIEPEQNPSSQGTLPPSEPQLVD